MAECQVSYVAPVTLYHDRLGAGCGRAFGQQLVAVGVPAVVEDRHPVADLCVLEEVEEVPHGGVLAHDDLAQAGSSASRRRRASSARSRRWRSLSSRSLAKASKMIGFLASFDIDASFHVRAVSADILNQDP